MQLLVQNIINKKKMKRCYLNPMTMKWVKQRNDERERRGNNTQSNMHPRKS